MIHNEQIAHDLAIAYITNRYGVDVTGDFSCSDGNGSGNVITEHLPAIDEPYMTKVETGEKNFLGMKKKKWVEDGYKVDYIFEEIIDEYFAAYAKFLSILNNR